MNENNVLYLEELGINEKEVKNSEEQGVNVVILDEEGRVLYKTSTCDNEEFCGMCPYLRLIPECEAEDCFYDDDMKAFCKYFELPIAFDLSPHEILDIPRLPGCPYWNRGLNEEEIKLIEMFNNQKK